MNPTEAYDLYHADAGRPNSDPLPRRILGVEHEFVTYVAKQRAGAPPANYATRKVFQSQIPKDYGHQIQSSVFLPNGARFYIDVGEHLEYASPECTDVFELLAASLAGDRIVARGIPVAEREFVDSRSDTPNPTIHVFKNNVARLQPPGYREAAHGCHVNVMIRDDRRVEAKYEELGSFLVAHQILAGSGRTIDGEFRISQRAPFFSQVAGSSSMQNRVMILTRDEPHADRRFRRLQLISGDANRLHTAFVLKVGTIELVINAIEQGVDFSDLICMNIPDALRSIGGAAHLSKKVSTASGRRMTGLDLLDAFYERTAAALDSARLTPDKQRVMDLWQTSLEGLRFDQSALVGKLDWVTKRYLLDARSARADRPLSPRSDEMMDHTYHDLRSAADVLPPLLRRGIAEELVTDDRISHFVDNPPKTRAAVRGKLVASAVAARRTYSTNWSSFSLSDSDTRIEMSNPYKASDARANRIARELRQSAR